MKFSEVSMPDCRKVFESVKNRIDAFSPFVGRGVARVWSFAGVAGPFLGKVLMRLLFLVVALVVCVAKVAVAAFFAALREAKTLGPLTLRFAASVFGCHSDGDGDSPPMGCGVFGEVFGDRDARRSA